VKGYKEDTILSWLRDAREHLEAVEEILLKNYRVTRGQLDAMWGNETLASIKVFETLKSRGHPDGPPPTILIRETIFPDAVQYFALWAVVVGPWLGSRPRILHPGCDGSPLGYPVFENRPAVRLNDSTGVIEVIR
jgi:hypothetical protein